jgi:hypothetical protein
MELEKMEVEVEEKLPPRVKDLRGIRFSHLVVERFAGFYVHPKGERKALWQTRCNCGTTVVVRGGDLKSGKTMSCGCWNRESSAKRIAEQNTTHGHTAGEWKKQGGTPTFRSWKSMMWRTNDVRNPTYGGRPGNPVQVCEGLRTFEGFISTIGDRQQGMTLDRIDPNGMYSCGGCGHCEAQGWARNVRWADKYTQARGKRNTRLTPEKVAEIRAASGLQREIAAHFGIDQSYVSQIKRGKIWANVGEAA